MSRLVIVPSAIFADVMRLAAVAVVPVAASAQIAPTAIVLVLFMMVPSVRVCGCRGAFCGR